MTSFAAHTAGHHPAHASPGRRRCAPPVEAQIALECPASSFSFPEGPLCDDLFVRFSRVRKWRAHLTRNVGNPSRTRCVRSINNSRKSSARSTRGVFASLPQPKPCYRIHRCPRSAGASQAGAFGSGRFSQNPSANSDPRPSPPCLLPPIRLPPGTCTSSVCASLPVDIATQNALKSQHTHDVPCHVCHATSARSLQRRMRPPPGASSPPQPASCQQPSWPRPRPS